MLTVCSLNEQAKALEVSARSDVHTGLKVPRDSSETKHKRSFDDADFIVGQRQLVTSVPSSR